MRTAMMTIPGMLLEVTDRCRKPNAFQYKDDGQWVSVSTENFVLGVEEAFHGLRALGIRPGDRVAVFSENRLEWAICDYGAQSAGAIVVPIYPTLSPPQIETLLNDSEARLVFVSGVELLVKLRISPRKVPNVKYVVAFDSNICQPDVMRLDTLLKIGKQGACDYPTEFRREIRNLNPEDVATIIYTSGTTGVPKGAMLTHRNVLSNVVATTDILPLSSADTELSFLPLSHVFQRHVDYAAMYSGATIAYAEGLATVLGNIREVRPTFVAGVPRFFEKVRAVILSEIEKGPAARKHVFDWALRTALQKERRSGVQYALADRLVFRKLRKYMGGRIRWFISGGAALEPEVAEFFYAVGLPILEGYGLTETSPVIALSRPGETRIGSVGKPIGDVEIRIAADGEILVRGSNVMTGYFRRPRDTQESLRDGWFHTGDIGVIDNQGYLQVTDRKKDLIVTSSGKNVAPQPIENRLKLIRYFDNVVLIGDRRNFISALVVPNMEAITSYAKANNIVFQDPIELLDRKEINDLAMREIDARSQDLASFERVRKVAFVDRPFSIDSGELTPTLKIRRSVIQEKFRKHIDKIYAA